VLILAFLAASCGGAAKHSQTAQKAVHGAGFRFEAPAGWSTRRTGTAVVVRRDPAGGTLVSATAFTLLKAYSPKLFDRAAVRKLLDGQARGLRNSERLFALLLLELWRQEYRIQV